MDRDFLCWIEGIKLNMGLNMYCWKMCWWMNLLKFVNIDCDNIIIVNRLGLVRVFLGLD